MTKIELIAQEQVFAGRKVAMSAFELYKSHKVGGDYYFRAYVRAFNKELRAVEAKQNAKFVESNISLVGMIKEQTATVAAEYFQTVTNWANAEFDRVAAFYAAPWISRDKFFTTPEANRYGTFEYREATKARNAYENKRAAARKIIENGREVFVAKAEKAAVDHYENSCLKLAARIVSKGMNEATISVKSATVGVNLETVFTDGDKVVRAFTIIASGAVQKPHYRYLVK